MAKKMHGEGRVFLGSENNNLKFCHNVIAGHIC